MNFRDEGFPAISMFQTVVSLVTVGWWRWKDTERGGHGVKEGRRTPQLPGQSTSAKMNTYNRAQGMDNRLNQLFNQELDNEAQCIKSHPFSSINMSLGGAMMPQRRCRLCRRVPIRALAPSKSPVRSSINLHEGGSARVCRNNESSLVPTTPPHQRHLCRSILLGAGTLGQRFSESLSPWHWD